MARVDNRFITVHTEGGLLPPDLLGRISDNDDITGLSPGQYHLSGDRLNEAVNRSWNVLQGAWATFRGEQAALRERDLGTSLTRRRWLLPLFRELAYGQLQAAPSYNIDGKSYPVSHSWGLHVPIHLVSYKVDLDKKTRGVAGAARHSPHSLLQVFLNRSDDHLWAFVSNGYKLRVLRDNLTLTRQAFVEFDLEAMMDGEVYSDFVLLWLLCHQSRVEAARPADCWLEKWMKEAQDRGTRAREHLRAGVEDAIIALGSGFLAHQANGELRDKLREGRLDKQNYYRQLMRVIYRLLFMFVAEDRDLLLDRHAPEAARDNYARYYSASRLRRMAAKFVGTRHADLFAGLRVVMRLLGGAGDGSALGIKPLGSFLFSDKAVGDIIDCEISNRQLLKVIRSLSLIDDRDARILRNIDYKNLGPEELGSVYEGLLELHPEINADTGSFALASAGGNERKTSGSYYTPSSLIKVLLDSALDPVLDEAARKGEEAILSLKICDPASGSGHFLIAAANRMAKRLATLRAGEEEPAPQALQTAKRDVISRCIYGVDSNPMAAELCKVNLWLEALDPGKPLSFLDHHIQVGDSLLGTTPRLMAAGIPNDAFKPIEGDDKATASSLRKQNREQLKQRESGVAQMGLEQAPSADYGYLSDSMRLLASAPDDSLADVRDKEAFYMSLAQDDEYIKARLLADAWCAAFVWRKRRTHPLAPSPIKREGEPGSNSPTASSPSLLVGEGAGGWGDPPLTDLVYRQLERDPLAENLKALREQVIALTDRYGFFHWHVAFPDVFHVPGDSSHADPRVDTGGYNQAAGWNGGFDVVLGNPPWERIKIQEKEWFAGRDPDIAGARNAAARRRMIAALAETDPAMHSDFLEDKRKAEGISHFIRVSQRYPLCGRGDVNTYTVFAELDRFLLNGRGRVGMVCPSGIATDDTTKFFFQDLMDSQSLARLYDFENRQGLFPGVHRSYKFCLLTMTGADIRTRESEFVFFALNIGDLDDDWRRFKLSAADIAMLNPNTGTMATFRSQRDAEITKAIYRRVPVLLDDKRATASTNVLRERANYQNKRSTGASSSSQCSTCPTTATSSAPATSWKAPATSSWATSSSWGIRFQRMFDMSNDSDKFRTRDELEARGFRLEGNVFVKRGDEEA